MKIVQIIPSFEVAGAEIMCENLIYELIKLGHQVITVSMYNYKSAITERLENSGVRITYLDKNRDLIYLFIKRLVRYLKRKNPMSYTLIYILQNMYFLLLQSKE